MTTLRARLCAALLAAGRPVPAKDLQQLLEVSPEGLTRSLKDLRQTLEAASLGVEIEAVAGGYQLVVSPAIAPQLVSLLAPPPLPNLSAAALETLALVAYHQPVTRGELEAARGANCASTVETLLERELIKVVGRREVIGRPELLATTERFLIEFGLRSLDDLPAVADRPDAFLRG
ncbi:MAG: SMC-Scp complex subunit ScpB [Trueperaceae bacterium]|nr:SMC-Scp complex subunit ScpB [Trueperaceae bacterium]